jgi:putative transposase
MGDTSGMSEKSFMPWKETCPMDEKSKLIGLITTKSMKVAEACRHFGVSRKSAYKWMKRYEKSGVAGLEELSRRPKRSPFGLSAALRAKLIALRKRRPTWGARKMLASLAKREPDLKLPAASTVSELIKREGLVKPRRRHARPPQAPPTELLEAFAPNDCWCADYKGDFIVGNRPCYPLTVTDNYSRFLLACEALGGTTTEGAWPVFERLFVEYGLPRAIRTDNGTPFVSPGLGGLTRLSVWWLRLGIRLERITKGKPQQNGRHERMHKTLKAEAITPLDKSFAEQQRRFDDFRVDFNVERPHEGLGNDMPAEVYAPSSRDYRSKLPELEYPGHFAMQRVRPDGYIKLKKMHTYVSLSLIGEIVGLEEFDDQMWSLHFGTLRLGIINGRLTHTPKVHRLI